MKKSNHISKQTREPETNQGSQKPSSTASKATIIVVSRAITILFKISSIMILTRILIKHDFALLSFVLLAYTTLTTLLQLGLPDSIFYFFERVPGESRKSLALLTAKTLFFCSLVGVVILIILTFLAPMWGFQVGGLFLPMIFLVLLELPTTPISNILIAIDRAKQAANLNVILGFSQFTAIILPAVLGQPLKIIIFCLVGYGVVAFTLSSYVFFRNFPHAGGSLPKGMVKTQLHYSVPLALAQILWKINTVVDKFIVAAYLPVAVFAEYTVGSWEIPLIPMISSSVVSVMMPQIVASHLRGNTKKLLTLWFKSIEKVSIIVLPLIILFLLVAEEFIAMAFSQDYIRAVVPFRIYTMIIFYRVAALGAMNRAIGNVRAIGKAAIYALLLNICLSLPMVVWFGVAGPPAATFLATSFAFFYQLLQMKKQLDISWSQVFPFRFYGKTLLVAISSGVPAFFLKPILGLSYHTNFVVLVVLYLISYAFVATLSGLIKRDDWNYITRGWVMKVR